MDQKVKTISPGFPPFIDRSPQAKKLSLLGIISSLVVVVGCIYLVVSQPIDTNSLPTILFAVFAIISCIALVIGTEDEKLVISKNEIILFRREPMTGPWTQKQKIDISNSKKIIVSTRKKYVSSRNDFFLISTLYAYVISDSDHPDNGIVVDWKYRWKRDHINKLIDYLVNKLKIEVHENK